MFTRALILLLVASPIACAQDRHVDPPPFASIASLTDADRDAINAWLTSALDTGGYPSLAVGIVQNDQLAFASAVGIADRESGRAATTDTIYRIGSVTKVFNATLLGSLRDDGVVSFDDPVGKYLPPELKGPTATDQKPAITLKRLACHTSGLPRLPINLRPRQTSLGLDPYAGYTVEQMFAGLARTPLLTPPGARAAYSNLGAGLLGVALSRAADKPWETLIAERITTPLTMTDTTTTLPANHIARYATGYDEKDVAKPAVDWNLGSLSPAGTLYSTVPDLAKFLTMQLRAVKDDPSLPMKASTLRELQAAQPGGPKDEFAHGIGWLRAKNEALGDIIWHNGGMPGHMSYVGFAPDFKVGVVVLTNRAGMGVEKVGQLLMDRLVKGPATDLLDRPLNGSDSSVPPSKLEPRLPASP